MIIRLTKNTSKAFIEHFHHFEHIAILFKLTNFRSMMFLKEYHTFWIRLMMILKQYHKICNCFCFLFLLLGENWTKLLWILKEFKRYIWNILKTKVKKWFDNISYLSWSYYRYCKQYGKETLNLTSNEGFLMILKSIYLIKCSYL